MREKFLLALFGHFVFFAQDTFAVISFAPPECKTIETMILKTQS